MKNSFLILAALFPFVLFGFFQLDDSVQIQQVRFYNYTDYDVYEHRNSYFDMYNPSSLDDLVSLYYNHKFSFKTRSRQTTNSNFGFILPSSSSLIVPATAGKSSISNSLVGSSNGVSCVISPLYVPRVSSFYVAALSLFKQGYRGPGLEVFNSGVYSCVNVYLPELVPAVLSSTNTVFSQVLFSQLSSINSGVVNILTDLSGINSSILSLAPYNFEQVSNYVYSVSKESSGNQIVGGFSINPDIVLESLDPSKHDLSTPEARQLFDFQRDATARGVTLAAALAGLTQLITSDPVSGSTLSGLGKSFNHAVNNNLHNLSGHVSGIAENVRRLSTNDWASVVTNRLANNTASITNQLAHMFDDPSAPGTIGSHVANISGAAGTLASTVSGGAVSVRLSGQEVFGVHLDAPVSIEENQMSTVTFPLDSLRDNVSHWYSDWTDFYFSSSPEKGWVKFFDLFSEFKDVNHSDLVSILSCVSNVLVSFTIYTNEFPFAISNAIAGLSLSSTNSYLLLSDYADYIHSGGLDALLDVMDDDSYIDLKSEIDSLYHADTAAGYGRWWRYFTGLSTVQANSIFKLSNIFQAHEKLLKDLKRDNSDLDVQDASDPSVFRKLLYTIPSEEDTFNKLSQLTNSIDQSGMVRLQQLIPDLTNRFCVAASLFDKDFILPSEISWTLIPGDPSINSKARIVTIRPSDHYRLFQMLHFGLAFSYCLVNIILFPKFLLFLVRLFDRVWNNSEKLIYNSTQS